MVLREEQRAKGSREKRNWERGVAVLLSIDSARARGENLVEREQLEQRPCRYSNGGQRRPGFAPRPLAVFFSFIPLLFPFLFLFLFCLKAEIELLIWSIKPTQKNVTFIWMESWFNVEANHKLCFGNWKCFESILNKGKIIPIKVIVQIQIFGPLKHCRASSQLYRWLHNLIVKLPIWLL